MPCEALAHIHKFLIFRYTHTHQAPARSQDHQIQGHYR